MPSNTQNSESPNEQTVQEQEKKLHSRHGVAWLRDPQLNKNTAFTEAERDALGLRGLLPPRVFSQSEQVLRVITNFHRKPNDLEKYVQLVGLLDRSETLFYRVLMDNLEEMMPIIYTPTVGKACQEYGTIFRRPHGLYISINDLGKVAEILQNWPEDDVRAIVVTDGERILGLGDLGAHGMGIPVGKLALYTACAGVHPRHCLPVTLDVGTENETLLNDPLYNGLQQHRVRGNAYDALVEEFILAVEARYPNVLVQFEDFANANAFRLLKKYENRICTFNDDIQGTASVALAGILSALRLTNGTLKDQRILFSGAGEAGIGIGNLVVVALQREGLTEQEARERCWFVDSQGLIVKARENLVAHKRDFAHDHALCPSLMDAIVSIKPTLLIGVSGTPKAFTQQVLETMATLNERPIIFALSNPTSKSECTAEEAYRWTDGRAIFASGSPFDPVEIGGKTFTPGQGNNVYIFPGMGLGIIACGATRVTDSMFYCAAKSLADQVQDVDLDLGRIYPSLQRIREVSVGIALAVAEECYRLGVARYPRPEDLVAAIKAEMYQPDYEHYA